MPDYVQTTLDFLDNWDTGRYSPQPELIDDENSEYYSSQHSRTGERVQSHDLTSGNAISVGSQPTTTQTAVGTEYDHRVRAGVGVTIEAAHEDVRGDVTGASDFKNLVGEARRLILAERTFPIPSENIHTLFIEEEDNLSAGDRDYFRYEFDVWYEGYEEL